MLYGKNSCFDPVRRSWCGESGSDRNHAQHARNATRLLLEECIQEVSAVARASRIKLSDTVVADTMNFIDTLAPNATTSLQRDIAEGKPSEIDFWNGAVVRLGQAVGVTTPVN